MTTPERQRHAHPGRLLIVNGASASGKSTVIEKLVSQHPLMQWIHPDGLWDTPNMQPDVIFRKALDLTRGYPNDACVIDCQIRPRDMQAMLATEPVERWRSVLLDCARPARETRLRDRAWDDRQFERIDSWARMLRSEALALGQRVIDTGVLTVAQVCRLVNREFTSHLHVTRGTP